MIYLDHAATTRPHPDVVAATASHLEETYHNPSAQYATDGAEALDTARKQIVELIGGDPAGVILTGGGSEADNLALKGLVAGQETGHIVTATIEHPAVYDTCQWIDAHTQWDVSFVSPRSDGRIDPAAVSDAMRDDTHLVSVMHANNETGVVQPIETIASIAADYDAIVHSDTVQSVGKLPVNMDQLGIDMASLSAHKFYGPKGVGALYVRPALRERLTPVIHGGGQEGGLRSGTENVPGIAGMGIAAARAREDLEDRANQLAELRDTFVREVQDRTRGTLVGHPEKRLPGYALFCFDGYDGSEIVDRLAANGVAVSSGSACHSGTPSPSRVLTAMGVKFERAMGAVRFSMGRDTSQADVRKTVDILEAVL